ncbi:PHP domain-containing protein [bacterium]|nr:PHP domain-containing protein [Gemmiger sp.]MCI7743595.1 PHP domain-containing protein [bacterium]MDY5782563.1 PHP domain-containing protein [Gemmiger sp.]
MIEFIRCGAPQYKANLHSHSTLSDGCLTPEEMAAAYREQGYSILAITDHEAPYDHTALSSQDFLLVTGYEAYIRPDPNCRYNPLAPEIHLNLLAKDPHNLTFVGYRPEFCKYMPLDLAQSRPRSGPEGPRRYAPDYIQSFIDAARQSGYLVSYNHPIWSMEDVETILGYEGIYSLEIFNTGSALISGDEDNGALYDRLLRLGKNWYCHGADDNHNKVPLDDPDSDSFGAWTMVLADELSYPSVMKALEEGRFYASTGPAITELTFDGAQVRIKSTPATRITMHISPKLCHHAAAPRGQTLTEASFTIPDNAPYVRFTVQGADGTRAETHAFTRAALGL